MAQFLVNDVVMKSDSTPMLMTFQNGYPTDAVRKQPCTVLRDTNNGTNTYVTEINDMLYTGSELHDNMSTLLVIRNKVTGHVRIVESGYIDMKPSIQTEVKEQQEIGKLDLSRKFGSKKQKQQVEQREKLTVKLETVTEQMREVTENIKSEEVDLAAYTANDAEDFYIPPIDRNAQRPDQVYDISKILTEDEYESISSQLDGKDFESDMVPWLNSLLNFKKLPPRHAVLGVYANSLLKLYNTIARDINKKTFCACPLSTTLNDVIIKNFTLHMKGKLLRPGPYKDKALCYAMVLILLVNNLKFDLEGFCQAMKLTATNAAMKVRTTGATVVASGGKKLVQLKLPLNTKSGFRRKSSKF